MRQKKSVLILCVLLFAVTLAITAQTTVGVTILPVALLTVSSATDPTFTVDDTDAVAGGMPTITPLGTPTYLQYTVVTTAAAKITATCSALMLAGLKLDIWAATPMGTGMLGIPTAGGLMVDSDAGTPLTANLITGILSSATGSGETQGPAIYYTLSIDASTFAAMKPTAATSYTITYTLTQ